MAPLTILRQPANPAHCACFVVLSKQRVGDNPSVVREFWPADGMGVPLAGNF
jgi:hypothetical protein